MIQQTLVKTEAITSETESDLKRALVYIAAVIFVAVMICIGVLTLLSQSLTSSSTNTQEQTTSTARLSSACDNKPSVEIKRGEVASFNGTKIWFSSQGQPYNATELVHFEGPQTFTTIVNRPAGGPVVEYDRTISSAVKTSPIEVWSPSRYGYSVRMTVC